MKKVVEWKEVSELINTITKHKVTATLHHDINKLTIQSETGASLTLQLKDGEDEK